ncbi:MAG: DUF4468 domain-containing protein [Bacteroidota bacterium]
MKLTFLLSLLMVCNIGIAQFKTIPVDSLSKKVLFTEIVLVDSTSKSVLYSRAREWFVHTFKSADDVIQMEDKESGKIIGKAYSEITLPPILGVTTVTKMYFTISVFLKDNRFKYEIGGIFYKSNPTAQAPSQETTPEDWYNPETKMYKSNGKEKPINRGYYDRTLESINSIIKSLKSAMSLNTKKEDGW